MNERERTHPNHQPPLDPAAGDPPAGGENLNQLRQQAGDYLAASDAIIKAALSTNTAAFLNAARQQGGQ